MASFVRHSSHVGIYDIFCLPFITFFPYPFNREIGMEPLKLVEYELPPWVEFISNDWLQTIIAKHYAKKVKRKLKRYEFRQKRTAFFRSILDKTK